MLLLTYLVTIFLLFGQLAWIDLGSGVRFYLIEPALILIVLAGIITTGWSPFVRLLKQRYILLWFGWIIAGWAINGLSKGSAPSLQSGLYIIRLLAYLCAATYIVAGKHTPRQALLLYFIPIICLLQYVLFPDLRFLQQYGWDPHMYRAVGLIFDPPVVGGVLGILWCNLLFRQNHVLFHNRKIYVFSAISLFLSIIFLYSRSTYVALLIVTSIFLISKKRWILLVLFVGVTLVAITLAPLTIPSTMNLESAKLDRSSTSISRITEIREGIAAWLTSPIIGIGYGRVAEYKSQLSQYRGISADNHANSAFHSFWVTQLATTGIVGCGLLVYLILKLIIWKKELVYPLIWVSIIGVFDNVVFHPLVLLTFILVFTTKPPFVSNSEL